MKKLQELCLNEIGINFERFINICCALQITLPKHIAEIICKHYKSRFFPNREKSLLREFEHLIQDKILDNKEENSFFMAFVTPCGLETVTQFISRTTNMGSLTVSFDTFRSCKKNRRNLQMFFDSISKVKLKKIKFLYTAPECIKFNLNLKNLFNCMPNLTSVKFIGPMKNVNLVSQLLVSLTSVANTLETLSINFLFNEITFENYVKLIEKCPKLKKIYLTQSNITSKFSLNSILHRLKNCGSLLERILLDTNCPCNLKYVVCYMLKYFKNLTYINVRTKNQPNFQFCYEEEFLRSCIIPPNNLEKLCLLGSKLNLADFVVIVRSLKNCSKLISLKLIFEQFFNSTEEIRLKERLEFMKSLEEIYVSGEALSEADSRNFGIFFRQFKSLKKIYFGFQRLENAQTSNILNNLLYTANSLTSLTLRFVRPDDEHLHELLGRCYNMKSLTINGIQSSIFVFRELSWAIFFLGENLTELDISGCNISDQDGLEFGRHLQNCQRLEIFNLANNPQLRLSYATIFDSLIMVKDTLRILCVGECTLTTDGMNMLLFFLKNCYLLEELTLFVCCSIRDEVYYMARTLGKALVNSMGCLRRVNYFEAETDEFDFYQSNDDFILE